MAEKYQDDDSDIEKEEGNEDIVTNIPFNPEDINIKIVPRNIGQLVELLEDNQILIPKYQRLPNLWSPTKKSRFIESLMLDLPIPLFYFDETDDRKWFVVDGLQRMSTLEHFMLGTGEIAKNKGKLKLCNLEFLSQYNEKTWDDLPRDIKRRINSNQVTINLIGKGTPDEVKYTIFSRINQGDIPLKPQEIRTALFQGYKVDFLEKMVSRDNEIGQLFHKVTGNSIKSKRQEDLDFASRFIAFYLQDYTTYEPDMDRFITTGTKLIPEDETEQNKILENFKNALELSFEIFGEDSFRKRVNMKESRKPINKPIFEVLSTVFSKLENKNILLNSREDFRNSFIEFMRSNGKFGAAITTGTATKESVQIRHKEFRDFITKFISIYAKKNNIKKL
ncbi:Protein of unknown function DUF262 [Flexibacter flexilis DSM 6793]|uniref:GmrSD restriction endonucleases N-terminal domain-containing protein n=1 Tax=Flexibacter flexilis DSM 6793 TaxID=927664 RepID=A0A1I1HDS1_9BACT|nr:DUF262 domain-containing protein [Flexibacter flexilis]SFC20118.1 Protein of unknown function DUF262 [Flexibacter flexilis DSM 6793]